jgi:SagB-type dehydrogenase family enzyme
MSEMLDAPVRELLPELEELLAELDTADQEVVFRVLRRSFDRMPGEGPLDEITLLHGAMKADAFAADYDKMRSAKAPPVLKTYPEAERFPLPGEILPLAQPLDRVIRARASRRDYGGELTLEQLGTLLHYSYGIRNRIRAYSTRDFPVRFIPTSGGLQSAELYLVVNSVGGLRKGLYHYAAGAHELELINEGNMRRVMVAFCSDQEWVHQSSVVFVATSVRERLEWKYGTRCYRYMHLDVGFLGQTLYLVATALGLRMLAVAGFNEDAVDSLIGIDGRSEFSVLTFPLGVRPPESCGVMQESITAHVGDSGS